MRRTCRLVLPALSSVASGVTEAIRRSIPAYRVVDVHEHTAAVSEQVRIRVTALAERRNLSSGELDAASDLAARRAAQRIPIDALIAAYQAADQEVWRLVAEEGGDDISSMLPEMGRMMFIATSATTEVMAEAHSRVSRDIDLGRLTLGHHLLRLLSEPGESPEATEVAVRLGFDPSAPFVGLACELPLASEAPHQAVAALRSAAIDVVARAVGEHTFELVAQGEDPDALVDFVRGGELVGRWGIGLARVGLAGAATSLADARFSLQATSLLRPAASLADHWIEALVLAERERLQPIVGDAARVARSHPHLAETVLAYADADMSIAATSDVVHLHANSVTYRLDRWRALTGFDPRTFQGLAHSVLACRSVVP